MTDSILHTIIDVLAGRRNLAAHDADAMHEAITPGYTRPLPSSTDIAAAQALLQRAREVGENPDRPVPAADPTPVPDASAAGSGS